MVWLDHRHTPGPPTETGSPSTRSSRGPSRSTRTKINGKLANKKVFKGARLTVTGQRKPGDAGAKVLLQRHTRGWHTIATTRTKRHGRFTVGAKASSLGK